MAGADRMAIEEVVRKVLLDEHADVVREAVKAVAAEMMELEVAELIGAQRGERRPDQRRHLDFHQLRRDRAPTRASRRHARRAAPSGRPPRTSSSQHRPSQAPSSPTPWNEPTIMSAAVAGTTFHPIRSYTTLRDGPDRLGERLAQWPAA